MTRPGLGVASILVSLAVITGVAPELSAAPGDPVLAVTRSGTGAGKVTSTPSGISCGSDCRQRYSPGTVVTLTADPATRSTFMGWKGGGCGGTGACQVTLSDSTTVRARFKLSYRPDQWVTLCGLSTGCTIDPPPHPWRGNGIYNATGFRQSVSVRMEDGEGVRFWLLLQNDGAKADTFVVKGCKGTRRFVVNAVLVGRHKRPNWRATNITKQFRAGTATFDFPPASEGKRVYLTLNIVAPTTAEGVTYECPVTITSTKQPTRSDTILTRMTTY